MRRIVRRFIIVLSIALILCEMGLRLALSSIPTAAAQPLTPLQHRLDFMQTTRYVNADGQYSTRDVTTPYFTIRNDVRLTTDQPAHWTHTIWLFGSSSVWGAYVDNAHTIASALQRDVNTAGVAWRVVNMGQPGINITLERYWLSKSDVRFGDTIIFIDGAVDLNNIVRDSRKDWQNAMIACQIAQYVPLVTLALWCDADTQGRAPQVYIDPLIAQYWQSVDKARQYANQHDATFVHVMQPAMPHDADLYALLGRDDLRTEIPTVDYDDELHYNATGNAIVARAIRDTIWQTF